MEVNEKFDLVIDQSSLFIDISTGSINKTIISIVDDDGK